MDDTEATIDFRVFYIRPPQNQSGSLGVHPDDLDRLEQWRTGQNHRATWLYADHPTTSERLHAFRPVEGNHLSRIEVDKAIVHGQLCRVRYEARMYGGKVQMKFVDIWPV